MDSDDVFDELLTPRSSPCDSQVRRAVLDQTTATVRRMGRWRRRRLQGLVAAGALCVLTFAGIQLVSITWQTDPRARTPGTAFVISGTGPLPGPSMAGGGMDDEVTAAALERQGETSQSEERAGLYRRAGDLYLEEASDPSSALRCYTQALDEGSTEDLNISAEDSWLLMALKLDRRKEKEDGRRN